MNIRERWILLALLGVGLCLRLYRLDAESAWYDEAYSLTLSRLPTSEIVDRIVSEEDFHPPLYYILLHQWYRLAGYGVYQVRLWSVLCGTGTILMIYLLARLLFDGRSALVAAMLQAISQVALNFGQEARFYAQMHLLAIGMAYFFVRAQAERRRLHWWIFVLLAVACVYTYYYGILIVLALGIWAVLFRRRCRVPLNWWVGGGIVGVILFLPWVLGGIVPQLTQGHRQLMVAQQPPWFSAKWWSPLSAILSFAGVKVNGFMAETPHWAMVVAGGLFAVPALALAYKLLLRSREPESDRRHAHLWLIALLIAEPMLTALIVGFAGGRYAPRYVSVCAAPFFILIGYGATQIRPATIRAAWACAVIAFCVVGMRSVYYIPYKEDYRDALKQVASMQQPGDCCVFAPFDDLPLQWDIYHADLPPPRTLKCAEIGRPDAVCERTWCVSYRRVSWAVRESEKIERQIEQDCIPQGRWDYYGIRVSLYEPRPSATGVPSR